MARRKGGKRGTQEKNAATRAKMAEAQRGPVRKREGREAMKA
jgi:hypothetical protein